jgi:hypothetical protein
MRDQTISALRWISVLPAAIVCYIVVSLLLLAKIKIWSDPGIDFLLIAVFPTVGFLIGGVMTAPAKRFLTAVVLTTLYVLVEISVAVFAPNPANSTSRVSVSIVICIAMCVWIRKGELPKKD